LLPVLLLKLSRGSTRRALLTCGAAWAATAGFAAVKCCSEMTAAAAVAIVG